MKTTLLKTLIYIFISIIGVNYLYIVPAFADTKLGEDACEILEKGSPAWEAAGCGESKDALPEIVVGILNAIIAVTGIVAVIFVLIGGINFMTSTGEPGKIKKAKDTILYALIGLIICVLSFIIVNFVIKNIIA